MQLPKLLKKILIKAMRVIAILTIVCICLLALMYYNYEIRPFTLSKFDRNAWIQVDASPIDWQDGECIKGAMVSDLKRNYLKPGITSKTDVLSLLGTYETEYSSKKNCLKYTLGICSFGVNYDSLYICFDKEDKINNVYTSQRRTYSEYSSLSPKQLTPTS